MSRTIILCGGLAVMACACLPVPARADFSGCAAAVAAKDPHQQIDLYTSCLKHGGLASTDVAGAFNNRGATHEQLGDTDRALQDFTAAIQYYPSWAMPYGNRASIEAGRGDCPAALADTKTALKYAPHEKQYLEMRDRLAANCPIISKAPN